MLLKRQGCVTYPHILEHKKTFADCNRKTLVILQDLPLQSDMRTDVFAVGNYERIKTMHVEDFLLSDEF